MRGLWSVVLLPSFLWAGVQVSAHLSASRIGLEDILYLTVTVEGETAGAQTPVLPDLPNFTILSGPSISQKFSMVNFQVSRSVEYTWKLNPKKKGTLTIPPISVRVDKKIYKTQPLTVQVVAGSLQPSPGQRPSPFWEPFNQPTQTKTLDVRMRSFVSKSSPYLGEPVVVTYELWTRTEIGGLSLQEEPKYIGFWVERVPLPKKPKARWETRDNKRYLVYTIRKDILFPTRTGKRTLPSLSFQLTVLTSSGFFGFAEPQTIIRKTPPQTLHVKPLPTPKPRDFLGGIGTFSLKAQVDKQEVQAGDAVALTLTLQGKGNFKSLEKPTLPPLGDVKLYEPKAREKLTITSTGVKGEKAWEWVFIPQSPGTITIPTLHLSYFDPKAGQYRRVKTAPMTLRVRGKPVTSGSLLIAQGGREVRSVGRDIHFIITNGKNLHQRLTPLYRRTWYILAFLLMPLINLTFLMIQRVREKTAMNIQVLRARRAKKTALHLLKGKTWQAIREALTQYTADRFCRSPEGMTRDEILQLWKERGVSEETLKALKELFNLCDAGMYGGLGGETIEAVEQARRILLELEKNR